MAKCKEETYCVSQEGGRRSFGCGQIFERANFLPGKPFTRKRPNSVPDCSTLFTSPYKYLHSFITRMAETCAVPRVPCKRKADPCKFLSVQKFVRTRFIRRLSLFHFQCRSVRLAPPKGPWFLLAISEVRVSKAVKSRY